MVSAWIWYLFAAMTAAGAMAVAFSKNVVHCGYALLFALLGVCAMYACLGADFLAATQVIVYVGGILVLVLFGVMMTHRIQASDLREEIIQPAWRQESRQGPACEPVLQRRVAGFRRRLIQDLNNELADDFWLHTVFAQLLCGPTQSLQTLCILGIFIQTKIERFVFGENRGLHRAGFHNNNVDPVEKQFYPHRVRHCLHSVFRN